MNKLFSFLKELKVVRILATFVVGVALLLTTACNQGDVRGARPENPPVQMGGNNNPHKMGGDGYTNYKATTDPKVNQSKRSGDRAGLLSSFDQVIADRGIQSNASDLLYPGSSATDTRNPDIGPIDKEVFDESVRQVPAPRQRNIDRSDPDNQILEKTGQAFKDASEFLFDTGESAIQHPEMRNNPGLDK